ncbi:MULTISPECIES: hypothetical protein [Moorena]|nr:MULTISPECIES: hypothetical protein [Moorena]NEO16302.1 hypothetical protein [Moorena sp. SIO3E8]NEO24912.1 hypothetical protein [Moorena sp. SIO4A5]
MPILQVRPVANLIRQGQGHLKTLKIMPLFSNAENQGKPVLSRTLRHIYL